MNSNIYIAYSSSLWKLITGPSISSTKERFVIKNDVDVFDVRFVEAVYRNNSDLNCDQTLRIGNVLAIWKNSENASGVMVDTYRPISTGQIVKCIYFYNNSVLVLTAPGASSFTTDSANGSVYAVNMLTSGTTICAFYPSQRKNLQIKNAYIKAKEG